MATKDIVKGCMEQVSRCVVLHDTVSTIFINLEFILFVQIKRFKNFNRMQWLSIWCLLNVCNFCYKFSF